ncbi:hypothetical protein RRF57_010811 [Xylaria bambusicola]|uniref:Uncharacterized protein n=1 Tax=Xylaria bambusicola TaxID=326684 RepID=A0AAN7ULT1_9PEZI
MAPGSTARVPMADREGSVFKRFASSRLYHCTVSQSESDQTYPENSIGDSSFGKMKKRRRKKQKEETRAYMNMISHSFDAPYRRYPVFPLPGSSSGVLHLPRASGSAETGSLKMRFHFSSS